MDQFSHDLTVALEETSLMDRASGVGRWGSRRRTRSTGNLPCAPQPTEDSSSSPTDTLNALGHHHQQQHHHHHHHHHPSANVDGLDTHNLKLPASDSDEMAEAMLPLRWLLRPGALESDSLNETTFSPARFYKPNSRRKRKIKRMSMEFEFSKDTPHSFTESPLQPGMLSATGTATGTIRKRLLKADGHRSHLFFCGKRKRSNRDRYHEQETGKLYTSPHTTHIMDMEQQHQQQQRMRPRSYSSTSKPLSDRLLPLNKGLLSKINRMAAQGQQQAMPNQKTDNKELKGRQADDAKAGQEMEDDLELLSKAKDNAKELPTLPPPALTTEVPSEANLDFFSMDTIVPVTDIDALLLSTPPSAPPLLRKKTPAPSSSTSKTHRRRRFQTLPQPQPLSQTHTQSMDCSELYDFLSSSSLSSSSDSEADVGHGGHRRRHDTDREGDDELTDWPGNEFGPGARYDPKRKLTKKSLLPQIRSDDTIGEDDTLMSGTEAGAMGGGGGGGIEPPPKSPESLQDLPRFQLPNAVVASSEPIDILNAGCEMETNADGSGIMPAPRQIESEMSGETSNPFLSSSPPGQHQGQEVREIRAGCRRINGERAGFSIKLSVNERLARFLQDPRQTQIRLPDVELYEPDGNLGNLATLYSLTMLVEHGCTVLTKTRNTTQSVSVDHFQRGLQQPPPDLFGDFKRRCYGEEEQQEPQDPDHK
ncbi:uncharacterized protein LOC110180415 [Drosophila serrata]|uniref:uncharacterized protein LOC110180415 n=1 Tax=Drosophila serrata TaxID=7274 RepID=UPI000A1D027B|nr:uncharacterized protein LOC110180415 [Drosophila serrata]